MKAKLHHAFPTSGEGDARAPGLWSGLLEWARHLRQHRDMTMDWSCCGTPMLDSFAMDLGRPDAFPLVMYTCSHCGARWLGASAVAPLTSGWRFVPEREARALLHAGKLPPST